MRTSPLSLLLVAVPLMAQEPLVRGDEGRRLDSLVRKARDEGFHGSVLVARRGQPVLLPALDRIPEEGIGRTVAAFVAAYNSADTAVMRRFYEERMASAPGAPPLAMRLERYQDMLADLGRLRVQGVRLVPGGDAMVVEATGESGEPLTLTLSVESTPPHRCLAFESR